jgi:hypothetical protein
MAATFFVIDTVQVNPLGTAGPTLIVGPQSYYQTVRLNASAIGVFIKGGPSIKLSTDGLQLPAGIWLDIPLPPTQALYGVSTMGPIPIGRMVAIEPNAAAVAAIFSAVPK